jgi:carbonic anhydrase
LKKVFLAVAVLAVIAFGVFAYFKFKQDVHKPDEAVRNWETAQNYLKEGNERFVSNKLMSRRSNEKDRNILKEGQKPFVVIVTCSDSRVSPEIYFDQKLGDIFVIRNAGNIADATALGSIEYAIEHLHVPLVVVVGHSSCGAVNAAYSAGDDSQGYSDNLQSILDKIALFVKSADNVNKAIDANISSVTVQISQNRVVRDSGAKVVGAHYNIETGVVTWQP